MPSIKIDSVVSSLVKQLLIDAGGRDGEALYFHFELDTSSYTDSACFSARKGLHLLYYVPFRTCFVDVFTSIQQNHISRLNEIKDWNHEASHDSCWRNVPVFNKIYMELADEVNRQRVQAGLKKVAPIKLSEHNHFCMFKDAFSWVPVRVVKDPEDKHRYRKVVEVL